MDDTVINPNTEQDKQDTNRFLTMVEAIRTFMISEFEITNLKEATNIHFESIDGFPSKDTKRTFTYSITEI